MLVFTSFFTEVSLIHHILKTQKASKITKYTVVIVGPVGTMLLSPLYRKVYNTESAQFAKLKNRLKSIFKYLKPFWRYHANKVTSVTVMKNEKIGITLQSEPIFVFHPSARDIHA